MSDTLSGLNDMKMTCLALVGVLVLAGCGRQRQGAPAPTPSQTLTEVRLNFKSKLVNRPSERNAAPAPPAHLFNTVKYDAPAGKLAAYVTTDPKDGKKHPAIVWITGGDSNSIDEGCWTVGECDDESACAYRQAGVVMMFPSLRGGNDNPGAKEGFLGEVDDILAAADYLSRQEFVDPKRIYLGGHSTGGTLVLLAAEMSDRFRAVFSFGPADDVTGYGPAYLPFDTKASAEIVFRSPMYWLGSIRSPVYVLEGTAVEGNIEALKSMASISTNPNVHFLPVRGATHLSLLGPTNRLIAAKIVADAGPTTALTLTEAEVNEAVGK